MVDRIVNKSEGPRGVRIKTPAGPRMAVIDPGQSLDADLDDDEAKNGLVQDWIKRGELVLEKGKGRAADEIPPPPAAPDPETAMKPPEAGGPPPPEVLERKAEVAKAAGVSDKGGPTPADTARAMEEEKGRAKK